MARKLRASAHFVLLAKAVYQGWREVAGLSRCSRLTVADNRYRHKVRVALLGRLRDSPTEYAARVLRQATTVR